jgi:MazG family protein
MSEAFTRLVELIAQLRDPADGCPWDLAQDHVSLRPYVVEEAHEVVAAIDSGHPEAIASELGDLLLQVLLHSRIAEEAGEFSLDDVIEGLAAKLVRRHPHVFGDASADLPSIRSRWETIKADEPKHETSLPTLLAARKLVSSLPDDPPLASIVEAAGGEAQAGGALLAEIARLWRRGIDPEIALRKAVDAVQAAREGGDA